MEIEDRVAAQITRQYERNGYGRFSLSAEIESAWYGRMTVMCSGRCCEDKGYPFVAVDTCIPYTYDREGNLTADNTVRLDTLRIAQQAERDIQMI